MLSQDNYSLTQRHQKHRLHRPQMAPQSEPTFKVSRSKKKGYPWEAASYCTVGEGGLLAQ